MLSIICRFNHKYEVFLKDLFDYVITRYGNGLELSKLKSIEMVKSLSNESDGRMIDEKSIQISSRLYKHLPTLDVSDLHYNDTFKIIVKTFYHELCHISEISVMPQIHQYGFSQEGINFMVALFWIEYIVERKSYAIINLYDNKLCTDVAKNRWNISKLNYDEADCSNYFYLTKVLPYVIARIQVDGSANTYIKTIKNPIVQSMVYELNNEVLRIEVFYPFDGIENLRGIHELFEKYFDFFMERKDFVNVFPRN